MTSPGAHWGTSDAASNFSRWIDWFCSRGIDIGMFELDVDLLDGRRLDELQETRLLPTRGLFRGVKLSSANLISCVAGSEAMINCDRSTN